MRRIFAAFALVATLGACTELAGLTGALDGTYYLETFNGQRPPVLLSSAFPSEELTDSELRLYSNGEYRVTFYYRVESTTGSGTRTETEEATGTFTRSGDELRFRDDATGGLTYAYVDGQRVEVDASGDTYVYRR